MTAAYHFTLDYAILEGQINAAAWVATTGDMPSYTKGGKLR